MKIVIGTTSQSKINALKIALQRLKITDYDIIPVKAKSNVRENPINEETICGAKNRNNYLFNYCIKEKIDYDILISTEAGYEQDHNGYYISTYAAVQTKDKQCIGKTQKINITKTIFEYVESQRMLHELINDILETKYIDGYIGFCSDNKIKREENEASAMIDALKQCLNIEYTPNQIDYNKYLLPERIKMLEEKINLLNS